MRVSPPRGESWAAQSICGSGWLALSFPAASPSDAAGFGFAEAEDGQQAGFGAAEAGDGEDHDGGDERGHADEQGPACRLLRPPAWRAAAVRCTAEPSDEADSPARSETPSTPAAR